MIVNGHELQDENKRNTVRVMITELGRAGVLFEEIHALLTDRAMRSVSGLLSDKEEVRESLAAAYPGTDLDRWFSDYPLQDVAKGRTYILIKMWGRNTEATLTQLSTAFPEAKVSFRAAES